MICTIFGDYLFVLPMPQRGRPRTRPEKVQHEQGRGPTQFPGIVADAKALGVNRATLYRMLTGEWAQLQTLRARYDALKAKQGKFAPAAIIQKPKGVK